MSLTKRQSEAVRRGSTLAVEETADVSTARNPLPVKTIIVAIIVSIAALQFLQFLITNERFEWETVGKYLVDGSVLQGLLTTLALTAIGMLIGIILGALVAACRMSNNPFLQAIAGVYVWIFRAIPVLVQLLFWYNLSALLPHITLGVPFGPDILYWQTNDVITPLLAALLGLTLNEGAYMAEIIRSGLMSVDRTQHEAASAIGMKKFRMYRRIIIPQAMRFIVPPTGSQLISMLKATSLVSVIAMSDLLYNVQHIYNENFKVIPLLTVAVLWYLAITSVLYVAQVYVERYYARGASRMGRPSRKTQQVWAKQMESSV